MQNDFGANETLLFFKNDRFCYSTYVFDIKKSYVQVLGLSLDVTRQFVVQLTSYSI